ncbi:hypothetical protein [Actinacidiphila yanglinensis]|uniref:hypothetical protein n=1 Tax=Actinacidiphila yanglinensis TaxID=310779 RepID=UPI000CDE9DDC|nr:hypothetical protein [Actinacidiphila yanglinensis]
MTLTRFWTPINANGLCRAMAVAENAPASFDELYGIPAPAGMPGAALVPAIERKRRTADA